MKFTNIRVMNFENALRGMRHPKESYHLSDSKFGIGSIEECFEDYEVAREWLDFMEDISGNEANEELREKIIEMADTWLIKNGVLYPPGKNSQYFEYAFIGPQDLRLAQQLITGGSEHRKFMRQIFVSVDITAPLYWWKEFDTYKVGTVANSTSTMHKIHSKPIDITCFETDDYDNSLGLIDDINIGVRVDCFIDDLEQLRQKYLDTKDVKYWKELIRWLPESWLQTRTVTMNYENLLAICSKGQRRFHKLNEWSGIHSEVEESFIQFARSLPYAQELIFIDELDSDFYPKVDFY